MDDVRIGRILRQLRGRKGWRQRDVADASGLSQSTISLIERGHLDRLSIRALRAVFAAVDARLEGVVTWRGGLVDRLLDERHARLVSAFAAELTRLGWDVHVEVTFAEFAERGSMDILALRRSDGIALVIEIKSVLMAIDDTIRRLDVKTRLAAKIVVDRFGWRPSIVARLLVIEDSATARRRVAANEGVFRAAFPDRGRVVRQWLRRPLGPLRGLRFFSSSNEGGSRPGGRWTEGSTGANRPSPTKGSRT
jgi:transcriptional regulator with XRE-family HTH domain